MNFRVIKSPFNSIVILKHFIDIISHFTYPFIPYYLQTLHIAHHS